MDIITESILPGSSLMTLIAAYSFVESCLAWKQIYNSSIVCITIMKYGLWWMKRDGDARFWDIMIFI